MGFIYWPISQLSALERYSGSPCQINVLYDLVSEFACSLEGLGSNKPFYSVNSQLYHPILIGYTQSPHTLNHRFCKSSVTLGLQQCTYLFWTRKPLVISAPANKLSQTTYCLSVYGLTCLQFFSLLR